MRPSAVTSDRERHVGRGERRDQERHAPPGEHQADGAAGDGEEQRFGQHQPRQPGPAGAERHAQGQLALPRHAASDQQVGDVGAGDQQHAERHRHQQPQRQVERLAQHARPLRRRQHGQAARQERAPRVRRGGVESRVGGLVREQRRVERIEAGAQRVDRRAVGEPAEDLHPAEAAALELQPRRTHLRLHRERHEHLGRRQQLEAVEAARGHADHGQRMAVDDDGLADHVAVAGEAALPVVVAQHRDRRAARRDVVAGREQPARRRREPEDGEVVARDQLALDALGAAGVPDVKREPRPAEQPVDAGHAIAEIAIHRPRQLRPVAQAAAVGFGALRRQLHELAGPRHRQTAQRDLIEQREDRGAGADAEGDRGDRDQAEERRAGRGCAPRGGGR